LLDSGGGVIGSVILDLLLMDAITLLKA
jgi:hypothetical protein